MNSLAPNSSSAETMRPARLPLGKLSLTGRFLRTVMRRLSVGKLIVVTPSGERVEHVAARPGPEATWVIHDWRAVRRLLTRGHLGLADSFMDGEWSSPDLAALLELGAVNQQALGKAIEGWRLPTLKYRLHHRARENTKRGSKRNIEAHYDLGNEFYAEWLDPGMSYSSAIYSSPGQSLEAAQDAKQARIMAALALRGGERVLEIGCGWGGLAEAMIRQFGCHVTGLTLSPAQLRHARQRLDAAGLADGADLRLQDYRDVGGLFDRIVSIEMLEAVGAKYWPAYFDRLRACLAPGGTAVLQVITIDESLFESYHRDTDFIQRHIFPGGMLPSVEILRAQVARAGLVLRSMEHFGDSYAATLAEWGRRFQAAWPRLRGLGFDEVFRRKWSYYFAYCEAGFRAGTINVGLYQLGHAGPGG